MFLRHNVKNLHLSGKDKLIQTGGAFFAPASATSVIVESILLNQSRLLSIAASLQGGYGLDDVVIGVTCWLGLSRIESVLELNLNDRYALV